MEISARFKSRHPDLMDALGTYHRAKGRILSGIGDRATRPSGPHELKELRKLDPQFDKVNVGIRKVREDIKKLLVEFDRDQSKAKS